MSILYVIGLIAIHLKVRPLTSITCLIPTGVREFLHNQPSVQAFPRSEPC